MFSIRWILAYHTEFFVIAALGNAGLRKTNRENLAVQLFRSCERKPYFQLIDLNDTLNYNKSNRYCKRQLIANARKQLVSIVSIVHPLLSYF